VTSTVRPATPADTVVWVAMRKALYGTAPGEPADQHAREAAQYFAGQLFMPAEVLVAEDASGVALGFAELSIRSYAEGCHSGRVAYLEGWYVVPEARGRGVGRALVEAAERWAVTQGCTELASDTAPDNEISLAAHGALGFREVDRIVCFRKELGAG
jgi:aminoglycoside 6'-N-acetyltransferase I